MAMAELTIAISKILSLGQGALEGYGISRVNFSIDADHDETDEGLPFSPSKAL